MNDPTPSNSDIEEGYETPDDQPTHPSLITASEEHKEVARRRRSASEAPIPGGGKTKKRKRRKKGGGLFTRKNKKMIDGMSEGTIKRLSDSDTSFAAIMRARTKTREGMKGLKAYREALGNEKLLKKDLKALPNFLRWQKKQEMPIATKAVPVDTTPLVDAVPLVDGVPVTKKFVDNTVPFYRRGGRRTRRKRKRKRKRKTKRKKRRRKKRKTRRSKTRRSRRKKQHGGSVELENWRPTASYGFNGAGEFSKKIPTDSYPNFTTNPARY